MSLLRALRVSAWVVPLAAACANGGNLGAGGEGPESGVAGGDGASSTDTGAGADVTPRAPEGGAEASIESGVDASKEAGTEGGMESGTPEASVDAETDSPVGDPNCPNTCSGCCDVDNVCYTTHTATECPDNNSPGMTGQPCDDCTTFGPHWTCILDIIEYECFP